jgi:hypothetical protein
MFQGVSEVAQSMLMKLLTVSPHIICVLDARVISNWIDESERLDFEFANMGSFQSWGYGEWIQRKKPGEWLGF